MSQHRGRRASVVTRAVLALATASSLALLAVAGAGCVTRVEAPTSARPAAAPALPSLVVATRDTVLRLPDDPRVRLARPRYELPLRVREVRDGEATVDVDGGIRVSGVVPLEALGVLACAPGPVADHFYVGDGNLLTLRSTVNEGRVRVAGEVVVREHPYSQNSSFASQFRTMPFEAEVPTSRLCDAAPAKRHAGTAEDPTVAHGVGEPDEEDFPRGTRLVDIEKDTPVTLLDAPGGRPLHTIPASEWGFTLVWLRRDGNFDLVAAGGGPYLLGWIPAHEPRPDDYGAGGLGLIGSMDVDEGPMSLQTRELRKLPLHHLPAGTELQQLGVVRATLVRDGYGRVAGEPRGAWSYVVAAVDEDVTVEGWIETAKLGAPVPPRTKPAR